MAGPATILRELHHLRRHARDLQTEIERGPRLAKAHQAKIARQEELYREAQDHIKHLKVASHEKEVQFKTTLSQIGKHEKQLKEAGSNKEYDALKKEIEAEKKKYADLENDILSDLMQIEEETAKLPEAEKALTRAKAEFADFEKTSQARLTGLSEHLQQTQQKIKEIEAALPADVRPLYDRLIAARGEDALAAVENRTCQACYTAITAQAYNDLMLSQFLMCKSCGRVLYLPE